MQAPETAATTYTANVIALSQSARQQGGLCTRPGCEGLERKKKLEEQEIPKRWCSREGFRGPRGARKRSLLPPEARSHPFWKTSLLGRSRRARGNRGKEDPLWRNCLRKCGSCLSLLLLLLCCFIAAAVAVADVVPCLSTKPLLLLRLLQLVSRHASPNSLPQTHFPCCCSSASLPFTSFLACALKSNHGLRVSP